MTARTGARSLRRFREIIEVLVRHGFGAFVERLRLPSRLRSPWRPQPAAPRSAAERLRLALEELGPTFIKLGQVLSTRPDLLPADFVRELTQLQDSAPRLPFEAVRPLLELELGRPVEEAFRSFDQVPLAAASFGQVHGAVLPDGREVVVKVQRPGAEEQLEEDMRILARLARLAQKRTELGSNYDLIGMVDEVADALRSELDYRREGRNADRFRSNFAREPLVHVPAIHWPLTTKRVLVMERLRGVKVSELEEDERNFEERHALALACARLVIQQVLDDGFFHADPHPGNWLLLEDGRIGVIDFGRMGHLEPRTRENLIRLYIAVVDGDPTEMVDELLRMGAVPAQLDRPALERDLLRLLHAYVGASLAEIEVRDLVEEILQVAYRHHLQLPTNLVLLAQALAMAEGVATRLDPDFDLFDASRPFVARFKRRLWSPLLWGPVAVRSGRDLIDLLLQLPRRASRLLDQAERGELGLRIEVKGLEEPVRHLDRIANRLAISLVMAALIIALGFMTPSLGQLEPGSSLAWLIGGVFAVVVMLGGFLLWWIWRSER